jgi:hypothetical protein
MAATMIFMVILSFAFSITIVALITDAGFGPVFVTALLILFNSALTWFAVWVSLSVLNDFKPSRLPEDDPPIDPKIDRLYNAILEHQRLQRIIERHELSKLSVDFDWTVSPIRVNVANGDVNTNQVSQFETIAKTLGISYELVWKAPFVL